MQDHHDESLPSLENLQQHIDAVKRDTKHVEPSEAENERLEKLSPTMRIGIELISAVAVAIIAGYLIDRWRDTSPWFTILFFFLGCAAGMRNIKRLSESLDND